MKEPYQRPNNRAAVEQELQEQQVPLTTQKPEYSDDVQVSSVNPVTTLEKKIRDTNEGLKKINGHSAEYVAQVLKLEVEELFPSNGKTVYIGDPWQKLDRKGVVIVDYEFGPVVEFQSNREIYLAVLEDRLHKVKELINQSREPEIQHFLETEIAQIDKLFQRASIEEMTEYEQIVGEFLASKQRIEEEIQRETGGTESDPIHAMDAAVRDLWYTAVHGARLVDVLDWATECDEPYRTFVESLPSHLPEAVREEKLKNKRHELIEAIRFEKTAKEAEVVQAMFPFLPFEDESFDRFVAFWSISTYAWPYLTSEDFTTYWEEIYRLLKEKGKAYISPLDSDNAYAMHRTLIAFNEAHPDFLFSYDDEENPFTLIIEKE